MIVVKSSLAYWYSRSKAKKSSSFQPLLLHLQICDRSRHLSTHDAAHHSRALNMMILTSILSRGSASSGASGFTNAACGQAVENQHNYHALLALIRGTYLKRHCPTQKLLSHTEQTRRSLRESGLSANTTSVSGSI
jgi:hypothetical protein